MQTFNYQIDPRFGETDALGHINHAVVPVWFEQARMPLFKLFNPELSLASWNLILKKIEVDYLAQIFVNSPVNITTWVGRVGNSSFLVMHEAHQNGQCVARGEVLMVYFDYGKQSKADIPADIRKIIAPYVSE